MHWAFILYGFSYLKALFTFKKHKLLPCKCSLVLIFMKRCEQETSFLLTVFTLITDLKCSITSVAHQWMLCSEWVPSEWESKQLIIKTSQSSTPVHQTTSCEVESCELSFWRHPFTAEHPLLSKWCNATFQICSDEGISVSRKEVSCSHLFTKIKTSEHLQRSSLCFLKVNGAFKYENPSSMKAQCMGTLAVTLTHCRCKRCETGSIYLLICPLFLSPLHLLISSLLIS